MITPYKTVSKLIGTTNQNATAIGERLSIILPARAENKINGKPYTAKVKPVIALLPPRSSRNRSQSASNIPVGNVTASVKMSATRTLRIRSRSKLSRCDSVLDANSGNLRGLMIKIATTASAPNSKNVASKPKGPIISEPISGPETKPPISIPATAPSLSALRFSSKCAAKARTAGNVIPIEAPTTPRAKTKVSRESPIAKITEPIAAKPRPT